MDNGRSRSRDAPRRKLFVSRDRLGVRPLFYTETPDSFVFASEVKALFECPGIERQLDLKGLDETFTFWSPLPSNSVFRNVNSCRRGIPLFLKMAGCEFLNTGTWIWRPEMTVSTVTKSG